MSTMVAQKVLHRQLLEAICQNAHELLDDAALLLENERWARSHAMSTFAMEEVGKGWLFNHQYAMEGQKAFKVSRDHEEKLTAARQMYSFASQLRDKKELNLNEWFSDEHYFEAEHDFLSRMAHLYVEVDGQKVVGGSAGVNRGLAERSFAWANAIVHVGIHILTVPDQDGPVPDSPF